MELCKDIKDEHMCVYTLCKKHNLSLSLTIKKNGDEWETLGMWPTV